MQHDNYEIHYALRGSDVALRVPGGTLTPAPAPEQHTMTFSVWRAQKDTKDEIHRIKAIARALAKSDEFTNVRVTKKTEGTEEVSFE